ncbi:MAG TPA: OmpH family outer membrane protein, partial [Candidatus Hydrogenedentes bacterium]|nr:OmpH family outer membrane protein [Candidatus Hydrogenedentota bacterium]
MNTFVKFAVAAAFVVVAAVITGPANGIVSAQNEAGYKIGVVDMDEIIKGYTKLKSEADGLQAERDRLQTDLDAKTKALQAKMEAAKDAPEADRERRRDEIETELRNLRADMTRMQGELD